MLNTNHRSIAIIESEKYLKRYLKKGCFANQRDRKYLVWGESTTPLIEILETNGFENIRTFSNEVLDADQFIKEYMTFIENISKGKSSRLWWATDLASKNRFTSKLPRHLHQFMEIIKIVEKREFQHLVILKCSTSIVPTLKYVLSESGISLTAEEGIFNKQLDRIMSIVRKIASLVMHSVRIYGRACYARWKLRSSLRERMDTQKSYYVIKNFIYCHAHSFDESGRFKEAFYGKLPDYLKQKKRNVVFFVDILSDFRRCVQQIAKNDVPRIIPIEYFISLSDIFAATFQVLFFKLSILNTSFFGYNADDIVHQELQSTYKGIQIYQLLHYACMKNMLKTLTVETFLMTYENNPWERMCTLAIKENSPQTRIIGYQHSIISQASMNMFMNPQQWARDPLPEKILTVGEMPADIIKRFGYNDNGILEPSCALRFEYLQEQPLSRRRASKNILVVLEGIPEVSKMITYVLKQLKSHDTYQVKIRPHPYLPWSFFQKRYKYNLNAVGNFQISQTLDFREDLQWADIVIYWGTTLALEALHIGKPVIHFKSDYVLSFDPLFQCPHLKWTVTENDSLQSVLDGIFDLEENQFIDQQKQARDYVNKYFHPVTEENLSKFDLESST